MSKELKVGDKLWFVSTRWRNNCTSTEVTVTKVGRKWIDISYGNYRIDKDTLLVDGKGYMSPGTCYRSKEEYEELSLVSRLIEQLRQKLTYSNVKTTSKDIIEAARMIGIELEIDKKEKTNG